MIDAGLPPYPKVSVLDLPNTRLIVVRLHCARCGALTASREIDAAAAAHGPLVEAAIRADDLIDQFRAHVTRAHPAFYARE